MADVKVAENANGDVALGVEVEGAFIPIAAVQAHRIGHLVERHNDLLAKVEAGGEGSEEAQAVLDSDFGGGGKPKTQKGGSE